MITDRTLAAVSVSTATSRPGPLTNRRPPGGPTRSLGVLPTSVSRVYPPPLRFRRTKPVNLELRDSFLLASEEILGRGLSEIDGTLIRREK